LSGASLCNSINGKIGLKEIRTTDIQAKLIDQTAPINLKTTKYTLCIYTKPRSKWRLLQKQKKREGGWRVKYGGVT